MKCFMMVSIPPEQAYQWMIIEKNKQDHEFYLKHGYHLFNDYNYLYPEIL